MSSIGGSRIQSFHEIRSVTVSPPRKYTQQTCAIGQILRNEEKIEKINVIYNEFDGRLYS
jgi:hypothetical protein